MPALSLFNILGEHNIFPDRACFWFSNCSSESNLTWSRLVRAQPAKIITHNKGRSRIQDLRLVTPMRQSLKNKLKRTKKFQRVIEKAERYRGKWSKVWERCLCICQDGLCIGCRCIGLMWGTIEWVYLTMELVGLGVPIKISLQYKLLLLTQTYNQNPTRVLYSCLRNQNQSNQSALAPMLSKQKAD